MILYNKKMLKIDKLEVALGNNILNIVKYICRTPEKYLTGHAPMLFPVEDAKDYRDSFHAYRCGYLGNHKS